jgi:hypothetical protein
VRDKTKNTTTTATTIKKAKLGHDDKAPELPV